MYRKIIYEKYLSSVNVTNEDIEESFNNNISLHKEVAKIIPRDKQAKILDIGCGYGVFLRTLQKKGYKSLYGVEVGKEENKFLNSKDLNVSQLDIFDFLEKDPNKYDLITRFDVFEHFKKNERIGLGPFIKDKLKSTGILVVRVPNAEAIFKGSIMYGDFTHETFFTKRSLIQLFNAFSFLSVDVYPVYNFGGTWKAKIAKYLYMGYVSLYKTLLYIDNSPSVKYFIPTQNVIAIIRK